MSSPTEITNVARDAYSLAITVHDNHDLALEAAVQAAIREAEKDIVERAAMAAGEYIDHLDAEEEQKTGVDLENDPYPDKLGHYRDALAWYAAKLLEDLPSRSASKTYEPADGDYIEVIIRGDVQVETGDCYRCGSREHVWWCVNTEAGDQFEFHMNSDVQVKKIISGGE